MHHCIYVNWILNKKTYWIPHRAEKSSSQIIKSTSREKTYEKETRKFVI